MNTRMLVVLFLSLIGISINTHLSADIIINMKDGRTFNVDRHWEKDGCVFFEMYEVTVKFEKNKVKEVLYTDEDAIQPKTALVKNSAEKKAGEYDSDGAAVLLANGKTLQTIKTYEQDGLVACTTAEGMKYFKKSEIQQIIKAKGFAAVAEAQQNKVQKQAEANLPPKHDTLYNGGKLKYIKTIRAVYNGIVYCPSLPDNTEVPLYLTENGSEYIWCRGEKDPKEKSSSRPVITRDSSDSYPPDLSSRSISRPGDGRYRNNWHSAPTNR